ncbi:hypothetical protein ABWED_0592 [Acinetobacter lwoffii]|nr:hypothetical protein ABWED_0592 [Acinetobacter lwoffii]
MYQSYSINLFFAIDINHHLTDKTTQIQSKTILRNDENKYF